MNQTIGQWICPSGNRVDAQLQEPGSEVTFCWDTPLTPEDQAYYIRVIRPEAVRKAWALSQQRK